jgi:uncharacterized protein YbjT (DUF2867 family)
MQDQKRTYVVTAATGRIGGRVARTLLQAGHKVVALGRDVDRLKALADLGAQMLRGDVEDEGFVESAFRGADAAFLLVSGRRTSRDFRRNFGDVGRNYANALRATSVKSAVFISCIGAHDEAHRGLVLIHADVEKALNEVADLDLVHLRAAPFYENLFYWLPAMQERRAFATPIQPDAPLEMTVTADVAVAASQLLLKLEFRGKNAIELRGRDVLTMRQIADKVAKELGRPFPVEQTPREPDIEGLVAHGVSYDFAWLMNDAWDTFSRHGLLRAPNSPASIHATTPLEDFLTQQFVPALSRASDNGNGLERLAKASGD